MGISIRFTATVGDMLVVGAGVVHESLITPLHLTDIPRFKKEIAKTVTGRMEMDGASFERIMIFDLDRVQASFVPLMAVPAPRYDLLDKLVAAHKKEAH